MRRLAIFVGATRAMAGGMRAYKVLKFVPSERYQHKVFEKLAASDVVKRDQSVLRPAKEHGAVPDGPITSELLHPRESMERTPPATLPPDFKGWDSKEPAARFVSANGIKEEFIYKPDLTGDYFEMQDGGFVYSEPSPSMWLYLLWIVCPVFGFVVAWGKYGLLDAAADGFLAKAAR